MSEQRASQTAPADKAATKGLPSVENICKLLGEILGKEVKAAFAPAYSLSLLKPKVVAAYRAGAGCPIYVCVCDLRFAVFAGAALSLIPAEVAKENLKAGRCDVSLLENLAEILNIARQWFQKPGGQHVGSPYIYYKAEQIPSVIGTLLTAPSFRLDLDIGIPGYGTGRVSIAG
jgi:hypothetical protein